MFDKIIGYESIKEELAIVADVLKNTDKYRALGVKPYKALLLWGEPGVGKTLMCEELIKASKREAFRCSVSVAHEELPAAIHNTFTMAARAKNSTAIVLLDDMDKMIGDDDNSVADAIQSAMESCKDSNVFVLATCNHLHNIPDSLLRAGRFGFQIAVNPPLVKDASKIIAKYLGETEVRGVSPETLAAILSGHSCAILEEVLREAKIRSIYGGREGVIERNDMVGAILKVVLNKSGRDEDYEKMQLECKDAERITAFHEAGHVVAGLLHNVKTGLATIVSDSESGGLCLKLTWRDYEIPSYTETQNYCYWGLGGMVGSAVGCGVTDTGCAADTDMVCKMLCEAFTRSLVKGTIYGSWCDPRCYVDFAPERHDKVVSEVYKEVEDMKDTLTTEIKKHKALLVAIAEALIEKKTIIYDELCEIIKENDAELYKVIETKQ